MAGTALPATTGAVADDAGVTVALVPTLGGVAVGGYVPDLDVLVVAEDA